jgi:hypothetical protein
VENIYTFDICFANESESLLYNTDFSFLLPFVKLLVFIKFKKEIVRKYTSLRSENSAFFFNPPNIRNQSQDLLCAGQVVYCWASAPALGFYTGTHYIA